MARAEEGRLDLWMPLYVRDWLVGTAGMEACERAGYADLLAAAWQEQPPCTLPDEDDRLRRLARLSRDEWAGAREAILSKFPPIAEGEAGAGRRRNRRQWAIWQEQAAKHRSASERGRKGAARRWWGAEGDPEGHGGAPGGPSLGEQEAVRAALNEAMRSYPTVQTWLREGGRTQERRAILTNVALRVYAETREPASVSAFVGELGAALDGMHPPAVTATAAETGARQWVANAGPVAARAFAAYLQDAQRALVAGHAAGSSGGNGKGRGRLAAATGPTSFD